VRARVNDKNLGSARGRFDPIWILALGLAMLLYGCKGGDAPILILPDSHEEAVSSDLANSGESSDGTIAWEADSFAVGGPPLDNKPSDSN
jgi:hypothetical protein